MKRAVPLCRLLYQLAQQKEQAWRRISNCSSASGAMPAGRGDGPALNPVSNLSFTKPSAGGRAVILDGRAVAAAWERELVGDVARLTELLGRPPGLGVVLVGSRPDSMLYVTKKQEACQKAGMNTYVHHLPDTVSQAQLEAALAHVCADVRVDGVLIQLPLPRHLSEEAVMEVLDPRKDVDGFHPLNMGRMLMRGRGVRLVPATPLGCIELLRRSGVDVQGKNCVVLGDSNIVGTPLAAMLRDKGAAAVTICHRRSYREWFEDQQEVQSKRAAAAVCLPRLPGPTPTPAPPPPPPPPPTASDGGGSSSGSGSSGHGPDGDSFQSYQLPDLTRSADILVVAVGHPELVRGDWVRPGAVVIDVGINVVSTLPRSPPRVGAGGCNGNGSNNGSSIGNNGNGGSCMEGRGQQDGSAAAEECGGGGSNGSSSGGSPSEHRNSTTISSSTAVVSPDLGDAESSASIVAAATASVAGAGETNGGGAAAGDGGGGGGGSGSAAGGSSYSNRNVIFQVVGDVAFDEVSQVAGAITTVPGGIGPMTIAAVLHNTLKAAKYRAGLEPW